MTRSYNITALCIGGRIGQSSVCYFRTHYGVDPTLIGSLLYCLLCVYLTLRLLYKSKRAYWQLGLLHALLTPPPLAWLLYPFLRPVEWSPTRDRGCLDPSSMQPMAPSASRARTIERIRLDTAPLSPPTMPP